MDVRKMEKKKIETRPVIEIILQEVPYKILKAYLESQKKKEGE